MVSLLGVGGYVAWSRRAEAPAPTAAKEGRKQGGAPIPVVAMPARKGDLGVYLTGLGSVTPLNTVTAIENAMARLNLPASMRGSRGRPRPSRRRWPMSRS
ncbi:hypothetical protein [Geobacter sp.]|uniref:hypothetical protein n=1 Tax=Geobacter sp. TaxID=46610 RepID=UPI00262381D6|nr:hypothetical protein [Geobacter sp.]